MSNTIRAACGSSLGLRIVPMAARSAVGIVFLFGLMSAALAQISGALSQKAPDAADLASIAQQTGRVRVIVQFQSPMAPSEVSPDPAIIANLRAQVAAAQDAIIADHFGSASTPREGQGFARGLTRFEITAGFAVNVTLPELNALAADPRVQTINHDRPMPPTLLQSIPLIGMPSAYTAGATGQEFAVAVLDTGVQSNHEFLAGKVIAEACFSNSNGGGGGVTLCPNGLNSQTGAGAANSTTAQCINGTINICQHGTHVSGIAAGLNTNQSAGEPTNGVGRNASLFAIQIFTRFNTPGPSGCGSTPPPCVLSFPSDQVLALDHVFANINLGGGVKVASVNMSVAGGPNTSSACDSDSQKPSIDNLRAAGVLTAIASGNNGSTTQISHPACISTATAVGSTTKTDVVSSFSNMSSVVDLLAPGGLGGGSCTLGGNNPDILSSFPGTSSSTTNLYACDAGTSMATPHVAGAIATIRTVCPTATADAIEAALKNTGTPITDNRPGGSQTKPRIRVDLAVQSCVPPPPPGPGPQACALASQLGDFNADGRDDLLFRRTSDGLISQYLMNGFQVLSAQVLGSVGPEFTLLAVADFNGDGTADMLFRRNSDGLLSLFLLNGPQVLAAQFLGNVGVEWVFVGASDFNGDGRADMLFRRDSDGMLSLYLMNGFQVVAAQLLGAVGPEWRVRGVRDFNGDGRADILFRRTTDGMISLYLFNGFQNIGAQLIGVVGVEWNLLGVRDFNGDGRADMLFRRTDGTLSLFLMNGFQVLAAQLLGQVGTEFTLLGLGDLNGDGRGDMVFRRTTDGLISIYLMNGFQVLDAQFLGSVGTEFNACYGQPSLAPAQISQR